MRPSGMASRTVRTARATSCGSVARWCRTGSARRRPPFVAALSTPRRSRVREERVEEVLRVVDHLLALPHQELHGVVIMRRFSARSTFDDLSRMWRSQVFPTMVMNRGVAVRQPHHRGVPGGPHALAPGHAERGDPRVAQVHGLQRVEHLVVLGGWTSGSPPRCSACRTRRGRRAMAICSFDRRLNALALEAIAERGVVEQDRFHGYLTSVWCLRRAAPPMRRRRRGRASRRTAGHAPASRRRTAPGGAW